MRRFGSVFAVLLLLACAPEPGGDDDVGGSDSESDSTSTSESETGTTETDTTQTDTTPTSDTSEPEGPRVLFIGNSYTFYNDLPGLFAAITAASGEPWIVDSIAIAGATVADHLANPEVATTLAEGWDHVVIQGQSYEPIVEQAAFEQAVVDLAALVDETSPGAELVLYETWAREAGNPLLAELGLTPEQMQQGLSDGYAAAAQASGARVAPVGQAWAQALVEAPTIDLFDPDGSHPSLAGSFLADCVFFAVLTGQPAATSDYVPAGLAASDADLLEPLADQAAGL